MKWHIDSEPASIEGAETGDIIIRDEKDHAVANALNGLDAAYRARLIAAAPDMAEALAAFIAFMSKGYQSDDELELIDRARATLARINGGSE